MSDEMAMSDEMDFDALLDQALDDMPLAPLPDDFMPRLMAQVSSPQTTAVPPAPAYQPEPFRLSLVDAVIPALLALLFAAFWVLSRTDAAFSAEAVRTFLFSADWVAWVLLIVAVEVAMGAGLCVWLFGELPLLEIEE